MIKLNLNGTDGWFITDQEKQDLEKQLLSQSKSKNAERIK